MQNPKNPEVVDSMRRTLDHKSPADAISPLRTVTFPGPLKKLTD